MSLADDLAADVTPEDPEYRPRTEFDGTTGYIQTGPRRSDPVQADILREFGYDPELVTIVGSPRISRWQQRSAVRELNGNGQYVRTDRWETVWLSAYKFVITPRTDARNLDLEALIAASRKAPKPGTGGGHWFVFQAGDQQLGKRSRDGSTEEIVERYVASVAAAKKQFKDLKRHGIEGIQISMPGDCLEGVVSQSARNLWLTQETITEQTRILRRLMYHTIDELSPLVDRVYLDVVNGNHDEATRAQNTYPGDGWATEQAIAVSEALKLNEKAYGHVEIRVPEKWTGYMTVPVGNTIVTIAHGHQWRAKGAFTWWAQQAVNMQPAAAAQVLQYGHYHEFQLNSNEHRYAIGSPTYDCGSDWFRNKTGATARRGGLAYLLDAGEISHLSLV